MFFTLYFSEGGSSFATHCFASCQECSFCWRVCSFDLFSLSVCAKKNCSSSATSEEDVVTSMGVVWNFSSILKRIFSVTLISTMERSSAESTLDSTGDVCYFEIDLKHIVTCFPQRWWICFRLEESCDWFVVCQNDCWPCCFPQNVCKLKKCHIKCHEIFGVDGVFELRTGEDFRSKRHGSVHFAFRLYFLI